MIVSSGFTRARETAEIVRQSLQAPPVTVADALQILQAGFLRLNPRLHRGVKHLRTAEIRPVTLARALAAVVPRVPIPLTGPARGR